MVNPQTITPSLKAGISCVYLPSRQEVWVGNRTRGCFFPADWSGFNPRRVIELFDGKNTAVQIASKSGLAVSQINSFIAELCQHDLVNLYRTPLPYLSRYNPEVGSIEEIADCENFRSDYAIDNFIKRMKIESDASSNLPGDLDGGRTSVLARREFATLLFGRGRIINSLVGTLSSAGFSKLQVINRVAPKHPSLKILDSDVSGGWITRSHIGNSRKKLMEEIRTSSALIAEEKSLVFQPNLVISVGRPTADSLQRWISENTNYLLVEVISSGEVRIGPLVIPGKTACSRCVDLTEINPPSISDSEPVPETSSALANLISGCIALDVSNQAAGIPSVFLATSLTYSTKGFHNPRVQRWVQHINCGCNWG